MSSHTVYNELLKRRPDLVEVSRHGAAGGSSARSAVHQVSTICFPPPLPVPPTPHPALSPCALVLVMRAGAGSGLLLGPARRGELWRGALLEVSSRCLCGAACCCTAATHLCHLHHRSVPPHFIPHPPSLPMKGSPAALQGWLVPLQFFGPGGQAGESQGLGWRRQGQLGAG